MSTGLVTQQIFVDYLLCAKHCPPSNGDKRRKQEE